METDAAFQKRLSNRIACAQKYAELGWHVLPVYPPRRDGADSDGKIPAMRGWQQEALTDPKKIFRTWRSHAWRSSGRGRMMSIGISTGPSKLVVIDIDTQNGGDVFSLPMSYEERNTVVVDTPSGGQHYYYAAPKDKVIYNSQGDIAPGVDVRATGGYVVAPPSLHKSGKNYIFADDFSILECEILPLPRCLLDLLTTKASPRRGVAASPVVYGDLSPGQRHGALLSLAGAMWRKGASVEAIEAALLVENELRCKPPKDVRGIKSIALSMKRYKRGIPKKRGCDLWAPPGETL